MTDSAASPSRRIPSVRLHVQTGMGVEASRPCATSLKTLCDSLFFGRTDVGERASGLEELTKNLRCAALDDLCFRVQ